MDVDWRVGEEANTTIACGLCSTWVQWTYPPDSSVWAWGDTIPVARYDTLFWCDADTPEVLGPDTCLFYSGDYPPDFFMLRAEVFGPYPPGSGNDPIWYFEGDSLRFWSVKVEVDEELSDRILDVPVAEGDSAEVPVRTVFRILPDEGSSGISFVESPAAAGVTYWHSVSYGPESGDEVVVKSEEEFTLGDLPFADNRYTLEWEQKDDSENWLDPAHNPYTSRVTMKWEREETRQPAEATGDLKCDAAGVDLVVYLPDGSLLPEAQEQAPGSGVFVVLNHGEPTGSTLGSDEQAAVVPRMVHMEVKVSAETVEDIVLSRETAYFELTLDCPGEGEVKVWKKRLSLFGEMSVLLDGTGGELSKRWHVLNFEELAELAEVLLYGLWVEGAEGPSDRIGDWSLELSVHADDQSTPTKDIVRGTVLLVNVAVAGLEEGDETTVGCFVPLNDDDDNHNGIMDKDEVGPITQVDGDAESMNEDNLVRTSLMVQPLLESGKVQVALKSNRLRLWRHHHKGASNAIPLVEGVVEWDLGNPVDRAAFLALQQGIWMEGYAPASAIRDEGIMLRYVAAGNGSNWVADTIATTVSRLRVYVHEWYPYSVLPTPDPWRVRVAMVLEAGDVAYSNSELVNDGEWYRLQTELGSEPDTEPGIPLPQGFSTFEHLDAGTYPEVPSLPEVFGEWTAEVDTWIARAGPEEDPPHTRDYRYERIEGYGGPWNSSWSMHLLEGVEGTIRLVGTLRAPYGVLNSRTFEYETRVSFRTQMEPDANGTSFLSWASTFLEVPYEWGGYWYGGRVGQNCGAPDPYNGYGMDCSGLICAAAYWAGYRWTTWRVNTEGLEDVSDEISPEDAQAGDILNKPNAHVVAIWRRDPGSPVIDIIEASPNAAKVRIWPDRQIIRNYVNQGYVPRRLRQ